MELERWVEEEYRDWTIYDRGSTN